MSLPESERAPIVKVGEYYPDREEKKLAEEELLKRVEGEELELEKPVTDKGQVLVTSAAAQKPKIVLPLTRATYLNPVNWHKPIVFAIRWLLVWAQRIIKMNQGRVVFENPK